ncbi:MAG: ATP-binding protein [Deltaproteobacteria bacterium]|nr:ATP-binding protein [Deltaproteobacteria bacterium]
MKQIAVFSGKGGTGKTSLVASFAALARRAVAVDTDVDAANLALLLPGEDTSEKAFYSGRRARIDPERCTGCGACRDACRFGAVRAVGTRFEIHTISCEGCGVCGLVCPVPDTITFEDNLAGTWRIRHTATGLLVHAQLGIAQDSSGKLVAHLRREAETLGERAQMPYLLIDGPPGIGCPVHAAIGGVDLVVAVTEPSVSGEHDLIRLLDLAEHFRRPISVVINKADLAPKVSTRIRRVCHGRGVPVLGEIPFDPLVPRLLAQGRLPLDARPATAEAIRETWKAVSEATERG